MADEYEIQQKLQQLERMSKQMTLIVSELLQKCEEEIERVTGEQFPLDVDLDSVKGDAAALDVFTENGGDAIFGVICRSLERVCADEENKKKLVLELIEIKILSLPTTDPAEKKCSFEGGTFTYCGAFSAGKAGCLSEEALVQYFEMAVGTRSALTLSAAAMNLVDEGDSNVVVEEEDEDEPPPVPTTPRPQLGVKAAPVMVVVEEEEVDESPPSSERTPLVAPAPTSPVEEANGCCALL